MSITLPIRILLIDQEDTIMKRQDTAILKAMMKGKLFSPHSTDLKWLVKEATSTPLIYMGDRDIETDEVLNFMPAKGEPLSIMRESFYNKFVFMINLPNYSHPDAQTMSLQEREQYRDGDIDVWAYIDTNPRPYVYYDDDGDVVLELGKGNKSDGLVDTSAITREDVVKIEGPLLKETNSSLAETHLAKITLCVHVGGKIEGFEWAGFITECEGDTTLFTVRGDSGHEAYYEKLVYLDSGGLAPYEDMNEELRQTAITVVRCICCLNNYLKYGDKHLVEVRPTQSKDKRNNALTKSRPWLNATGPHVLLLDRMPTTQKEYQGGTHASPKPHRRRGHWKRLQHPKYRHHPAYQKQIYVKPSFVGPKEVKYEGNIYRLVEPLEDIID